jgi:hypothetical protein
MLLLAALPVRGAVVIDGGSHYLSPGRQARLAIAVSGGNAIQGLNIYVQIGDGGIANGGTDAAPTITALDVVGPGTVFFGSHLGSSPAANGSLMWLDSITTDPAIAPTVAAGGTLAFLTIDTTNAVPGRIYPLRLQGVNANDYSPNGLSTGFTEGDPVPAIRDGKIAILQTMTWNKGSSGLWTESAWTGASSAFPDETTDAVIGSPHQVTVDADQRVHSVQTGSGAHLSVAAGTLTVVDGIGGSGRTSVGAGAHLVASYIQQDTLEIAAGGSVAISASTGGSAAVGDAAGNATAQVPEPGTWILLGIGGLCLLLTVRRPTRAV